LSPKWSLIILHQIFLEIVLRQKPWSRGLCQKYFNPFVNLFALQ
jgi:hypothetical protein